MSSQPCVLVVDDEIMNLEILSEYLEAEGFQTIQAEDGLQAWEILQSMTHDIDAVLLDRMMPRMDGIEVIQKLKANKQLAAIPVIFQTAAVGDQAAVEGLEAGAYYYLAKPFKRQVMINIVKAAVNDYRRYCDLRADLAKQSKAIALLTEGAFLFQSLEEAHNLATLLAQGCPNPERAVFGLSELLMNSVEHGNLEIGYDLKTELIANNAWLDEIYRRLSDSKYSDRYVKVEFKREGDIATIIINDSGQGFDYSQYEILEPERATHSHGRGIAMSKMMSFDTLEFQGNGNTVMATVSFKKDQN